MGKYTEPNYKKCALITIDVQNDCSLPGASMEVAGTYERRGLMKEALEAARACGLPIVHVVRLSLEDGSNVDLFRREAAEQGQGLFVVNTEGADLLEDLLPEQAKQLLKPRLDSERLLAGEFQQLSFGEWAMYKPRFGAFYQTPLEEFLRSLGVDTLVFMGCNFPNCPRTSIYEACERDFRLVVLRDALSALYEKGEEELARIGASLLTVEEWKDCLSTF